MSEMILTFLLPLVVWQRSFPVPDSLESWSATDPLGEVAAMGVPVIVAALSISVIVVLAFLAIMASISNSIRFLRSSVMSVVVAMAALVANNVMSSVVVDVLLGV